MVESVNPNTMKITFDEFSRHIQNHRDLFEAAVRNDYYLLKINTTINTDNYMHYVISGMVFFPSMPQDANVSKTSF